MGQIINMRREMGIALPYDSQIEWIGGYGDPYISIPLSVPVGKFFGIEFDCYPIYFSTKNTRYAIFGANPWGQCLCYFYSGTSNSITFASYMGNSSSNGGISVKPDVKNHVIYTTTHIEVSTPNGYLVNRNLSRPITEAINGFYMFCGYRYPLYRYPIRYCNFKITVGNDLVYDLIAVRKNGLGYMYDKLSGNFFGNSGTGSFTLGPDV